MLKIHSSWLLYCLNLVNHKKNGLVLDLACGKGESSIIFANKGFSVVSVDISQKKLDAFDASNITKICKDVENLDNWPLHKDLFDIVFVKNFLNREIVKNILSSIKKGGYLIYETFSDGNQKYGRPNNEKFILKKGELLKITKSFLLICHENVEVENYSSNFVKQRVFVKNV